MRYLVVAALALAGCAQVPASSMMALARFDPLAADLAAVQVAVDATEGLRVAPGGAVMVLSAQAPDGAAVSERFVLRQASVSEARWLYGVAPEDADRLTRVQQEIAAMKTAAPETAGQLSVSAAPCRVGAGRGGTVDVFVQLDAEGPWVPVAPRVDLEAEGVPVPPCSEG